mmetsp:Transcript_13529/g.20929  ORF Transcript_13529/g.20929 Transcript_13529/m.20929 type:complete len:108 (-) Transcript_13529:18-341(-)
MADLEDIEDAFHGDIFDETSDVFNPKNIEEVDNDEEDLAEEEEEEEEEEEDEEEGVKLNPQALLKRAEKEKENVRPSGGIIPGAENVYVKTWGCSHNNSDGEYMAGH